MSAWKCPKCQVVIEVSKDLMNVKIITPNKLLFPRHIDCELRKKPSVIDFSKLVKV